MTEKTNQPLPISWRECQARGWDFLDILLVCGDAYIDHPSFGVALIGRYLESLGYRVAILAQPRYTNSEDFIQFPSPRLFCGVTAGNLDSIVANYTGNGKIRDFDAYSPGGSPWRSDQQDRTNRYRPDRACMLYTNLARASFPNTPIILGGVEASLRRFVHYDYQQDKLRASLLTDAKADLLVFGMGEKAVAEIAQRCLQQLDLHDIPGTCERLSEQAFAKRYCEKDLKSSQFFFLPSYTELQQDISHFLDGELAVDKLCRAASPVHILQKQQNQWLVQHPAQSPLTESELDALYALPYTRKPHPQQDIPALRMIQDSITIVRGCSGNCSFCAITRHQGAVIQSRSIDSIVQECRELANLPSFSGTISDLGGPTANLYGTSCTNPSCVRKDCLYPKICRNLQINEERFLQLLEEVSTLDGIHHVFISSGLRMDLLMHAPRLMKKIHSSHTPGVLKIAPEHSCDDILQLMHKEPHTVLKRFVDKWKELNSNSTKKMKLSPYIISAHPGSTVQHARKLVEDLSQLGLPVYKFQDFTPTPGTISTAMYVSERSRNTGKSLFVAKNAAQRRAQRAEIERRLMSGSHGALNQQRRKQRKR